MDWLNAALFDVCQYCREGIALCLIRAFGRFKRKENFSIAINKTKIPQPFQFL